MSFIFSSSSKDSKSVTPHIKLSKSLFSARRGKLNPYITTLSYKNSTTSGSGAALSAVITVDPSGSAEWTAFQGLFDEAKVMGLRIHWNISSTVSGSVPIASTAILTYDPIDTTSLTSLSEALSASQRSGPVQIPVTAFGQGLTNPQAHTRTGFWDFPIRIPKGPQKIASATAADQEVATGNWFSTVASVAPKSGFIKMFAEALTGTNTTTITSFFQIVVGFRSRA